MAKLDTPTKDDDGTAGVFHSCWSDGHSILKDLIPSAVLIVAVLWVGPIRAEQADARICVSYDGMEIVDHSACEDFLKGYQAIKGWRCDTPSWSEYLANDIPLEFQLEVGSLVVLVEMTASAFCDKGIPDN